MAKRDVFAKPVQGGFNPQSDEEAERTRNRTGLDRDELLTPAPSAVVVPEPGIKSLGLEKAGAWPVDEGSTTEGFSAPRSPRGE